MRPPAEVRRLLRHACLSTITVSRVEVLDKSSASSSLLQDCDDKRRTRRGVVERRRAATSSLRAAHSNSGVTACKKKHLRNGSNYSPTLIELVKVPFGFDVIGLQVVQVVHNGQVATSWPTIRQRAGFERLSSLKAVVTVQDVSQFVFVAPSSSTP